MKEKRTTKKVTQITYACIHKDEIISKRFVKLRNIKRY